MDLDEARRKFEAAKGPYDKAVEGLKKAEEEAGNQLILEKVVLVPGDENDRIVLLGQNPMEMVFLKEELPRLIRFIKIQASKMGYKVD